MPPLRAAALLPETETARSGQLPPAITGGMPLRRPLRLGMINNPLSGRNFRRGLLERVRGLLTAHPAVAHFEENTVDGMGTAVENLLRAETEIIVVNGGDGTVQAVLTALLRSPLPRALPLLAVLPGGTTNTTARNVGYGRRPLQALQRLLQDGARGVLAGTAERRLPRDRLRAPGARVARHARPARRRDRRRDVHRPHRRRRRRSVVPAAAR